MHKIIAGAFLMLFSLFALGAQNKIVFLNGIMFGKAKSIESTVKIKAALASSGLKNKIDDEGFGYYWWRNPGDGFYEDVMEMQAQVSASSYSLSTAKSLHGSSAKLGSKYYKEELGKYYETMIGTVDEKNSTRHVYSVVDFLSKALAKSILESGEKIIVVSHSQGNFFAEAADAVLRVNRNDSELLKINKNLRFVGVASVAASTPNNRYVTIDEDRAIGLHYLSSDLLTSGFSTLPSNARLCDLLDMACETALMVLLSDPTLHGFVETYTSDLVDNVSRKSLSRLLADLISESFYEILMECGEVYESGACIFVSSVSCTRENVKIGSVDEEVTRWHFNGLAKADSNAPVVLFAVPSMLTIYYSPGADVLRCPQWQSYYLDETTSLFAHHCVNPYSVTPKALPRGPSVTEFTGDSYGSKEADKVVVYIQDLYKQKMVAKKEINVSCPGSVSF